MVALESAEEEAFVVGTVMNGVVADTWHGCNRIGSNASWRWSSTGKSCSLKNPKNEYTNWHSSQPNNNNDCGLNVNGDASPGCASAECAGFWGGFWSGGGRWDDDPCDGSGGEKARQYKRGYVCEYATLKSYGGISCEAVSVNYAQNETDHNCIDSVGKGEFVWLEGGGVHSGESRYRFETAPNGLLDGSWTYMQVARYSDADGVGHNTDCVDHGGGFKGFVAKEAVIAVCCANHYGEPKPVTLSGNTAAWNRLDGGDGKL